VLKYGSEIRDKLTNLRIFMLNQTRQERILEKKTSAEKEEPRQADDVFIWACKLLRLSDAKRQTIFAEPSFICLLALSE
jgi:hypothetical protein